MSAVVQHMIIVLWVNLAIYLKAWRLPLYFIIALASQTGTLQAIEFYFYFIFLKSGLRGVTGGLDNSVWYVWKAWLKNSGESLSHYYGPVLIELVLPMCQFASFFDASSKFSTRSAGQNMMKRHTWKNPKTHIVRIKVNNFQHFPMCDDEYWSVLTDTLYNLLLRHCLLIVLMTSTWNIIILFLNVLRLWSFAFKSLWKKGEQINVIHFILLDIFFNAFFFFFLNVSTHLAEGTVRPVYAGC